MISLGKLTLNNRRIENTLGKLVIDTFLSRKVVKLLKDIKLRFKAKKRRRVGTAENNSKTVFVVHGTAVFRVLLSSCKCMWAYHL